MRLYLRAASTSMPALAHVVRAGLFDVHVLAGLAGQNGRRRVPVVGRGDGHCVDGLVLEDAAHVAQQFGGAFALPLLEAVRNLLEDVLVHVHKAGDVSPTSALFRKPY